MIGKRPNRWRRCNERYCCYRWSPWVWPNTSLLMQLLHVDTSTHIPMTPFVTSAIPIAPVTIISMVAIVAPSAPAIVPLMIISPMGMRRKSTRLRVMIPFIIIDVVALVWEASRRIF